MKKIKYPLTKPYITEKEEKEVAKVLRSGWLTQGKYVEYLESEIKKYNKISYSFLVNSATSGLVISVLALELKKKDEVICPAFSFPATANSIILGGAKPVFCDIELNTFNISTKKIEGLITKNTKAIMPVSEFGLPADMSVIMQIAKKYNLCVIEDAACALGALIKTRKIGTFGDVGVFSFHPRKIITSGEGGCIVTDSIKIAKAVTQLRNHGQYNSKFIGCGFNYRMSDINAAILLNQFKNLENIIGKRIKLAQNYNKLMKDLEDRGIARLPACPQNYRHTYQSYVILLSNKVNRDKLKSCLKKKGVETQFGTYCIPILDFYRRNFNISQNSYRNAHSAYRQTLSLPLYHTLGTRGQEYIVNVLTDMIKKCPR